VTEICRTKSGQDLFYTGPIYGNFISSASIGSNYKGIVKDQDEKSMNADGATAISQCSPTNPTAQMGVTLGETMREGLPSLFGINSWKRRTALAKSAGDEYLNYQFGWAPLQSEVHNVVNAARHHRDIMQNYARNEGRNTHRSFHFPDVVQRWEEQVPPQYFANPLNNSSGYFLGVSTSPICTVSVEKRTKRWFEGCFTYGGPAKADNFDRHIGFGYEADNLYGLELTPDVLWNLTPWSWAVDWFSNAGDVIHNISSFGQAGLVMRYGYMMSETQEIYSTNYSDQEMRFRGSAPGAPKSYYTKVVGGSSIGLKTTEKSRCPANPFGFGVGWEGLSPTQLAITAALGITRAL